MKVENLELPLYGTSSWRIHAGWEAVYSAEKDVKTEPPKIGFEIGTKWTFSSTEDNPLLTSDETKPPRRFTESSIIQEMKKADIGRPSTYLTTIGKLIDRDYAQKEGTSLQPTQRGRTLWIEVVPFYGTKTDSSATMSEGLFTPLFTASMEANLDQVEDGNSSGADVWHNFVSDFRTMHNQALEERKKKPTVKQMNYMKNRFVRMDSDKRDAMLGGKALEDLTGDDARRIIESMNGENAGEIPASEKQIALMIRLSDKHEIDLDAFLKERGADDLESLSGGRDGTASTVIGDLIAYDQQSPATEKQVATIKSMCENLEMAIEDAMAIVDTTTIDEISKNDASILIGRLKKTIQNKRRKQKK